MDDGYLIQPSFPSTHPVWGGTPLCDRTGHVGVISIRPPRVGWDVGNAAYAGHKPDFNPPTPCGVGLRRRPLPHIRAVFQSTHPVWGGTQTD